MLSFPRDPSTSTVDQTRELCSHQASSAAISRNDSYADRPRHIVCATITGNDAGLAKTAETAVKAKSMFPVEGSRALDSFSTGRGCEMMRTKEAS